MGKAKQTCWPESSTWCWMNAINISNSPSWNKLEPYYKCSALLSPNPSMVYSQPLSSTQWNSYSKPSCSMMLWEFKWEAKIRSSPASTSPFNTVLTNTAKFYNSKIWSLKIGSSPQLWSLCRRKSEPNSSFFNWKRFWKTGRVAWTYRKKYRCWRDRKVRRKERKYCNSLKKEYSLCWSQLTS